MDTLVKDIMTTRVIRVRKGASFREMTAADVLSAFDRSDVVDVLAEFPVD
jgi:hypothetical protein